MFRYKLAILHAKSFLLQFLVTLALTVYIPYLLYLKDVQFSICYIFISVLLLLKEKKREKYMLLMLTIYKSSKLILFTNVWKNLVFPFAKSEFIPKVLSLLSQRFTFP
jgi:hypothetical protein